MAKDGIFKLLTMAVDWGEVQRAQRKAGGGEGLEEEKQESFRNNGQVWLDTALFKGYRHSTFHPAPSPDALAMYKQENTSIVTYAVHPGIQFFSV